MILYVLSVQSFTRRDKYEREGTYAHIRPQRRSRIQCQVPIAIPCLYS